MRNGACRLPPPPKEKISHHTVGLLTKLALLLEFGDVVTGIPGYSHYDYDDTPNTTMYM